MVEPLGLHRAHSGTIFALADDGNDTVFTVQ
jgi:hypothetical protein